MIYLKFPRMERDETISAARMRAAERAIDRQKQRLALFVDQTEFKTPLERIDAIDSERCHYWQYLRDHRAATWRQWRSVVHSLPATQRDELLEAWAKCPLPKSSEYFATFVSKRLPGADLDSEKARSLA